MIITVTNQKGGVGKTTTAAALAEGLRRCKSKTLLIDCDAQGSLTYIVDAAQDGITSAEVIEGSASARDAIQRTEHGDVIAGSERLGSADFLSGFMARLKEAHPKRDPRTALRKELEELRDEYQYIIIDTPPALGPTTLCSLTAADGIIITTQADALSLKGIGQLDGTISAIREKLNPTVRLLGILVTRYSERITAHKLALDMLRDTAAGMGSKVFDAKIRECAAIKEAHLLQRGIFAHAPRSNAAADYMALIREIKKGAVK